MLCEHETEKSNWTIVHDEGNSKNINPQKCSRQWFRICILFADAQAYHVEGIF